MPISALKGEITYAQNSRRMYVNRATRTDIPAVFVLRHRQSDEY